MQQNKSLDSRTEIYRQELEREVKRFYNSTKEVYRGIVKNVTIDVDNKIFNCDVELSEYNTITVEFGTVLIKQGDDWSEDAIRSYFPKFIRVPKIDTFCSLCKIGGSSQFYLIECDQYNKIIIRSSDENTSVYSVLDFSDDLAIKFHYGILNDAGDAESDEILPLLFVDSTSFKAKVGKSTFEMIDDNVKIVSNNSYIEIIKDKINIDNGTSKVTAEEESVTIANSDCTIKIDGSKIQLDNGSAILLLDGENVTINGGKNGGFTVTPKLKTELDKSKKRITGIMDAIENAPTAPNDGGATFKLAIVTALKLLVDVEDYSNIENPNAKH